MAIAMFFCFIFIGLPCLLANVENNYDGPWYVHISIGSYGNSEVPFWQSIIHCIGAMFFFAHCLYFRYKTFNKIRDIKNKEVSPRDFTILITGLRGNYDMNALKQSFNDIGKHVYSICPVYDIRSYVEDIEKLNNTYEDLYYIQYYLELNSKYPKKGLICKSNVYAEPYPSLQYLENKIIDSQAYLDQFEGNPQAFTKANMVFVTFNSKADAESLLKSDLRKKFQFTIREAPEPSDIIWENLCYPKSYKIEQRVIFYFISLLMLGVSLVCIYRLQIVQKEDYNNIQFRESFVQYILLKSTSYSISIAIVIINRMIAVMIFYLSKKEKYECMTHHYNAVFMKSYIAMCINSILTLIISEYIVGDTMFSRGGLIKDVFNLLIIDATVSPLTFIISPFYCYKLLKRFFARRKADPNNKIPITQNQANKLWENPEVDLAQWYANTLKTVTIGIVFAPIFPLSLGITSITLIIQYWSSKILLLRRHARSKRYGDLLSKNILKVIGFIVIAYILANIYFQYRMKTGQYISGIICLVTIGLYGLASIMIYRKDNSVTFDQNIRDYEEYLFLFYNDYMRANPITSKAGWKEWLDCIERPEDLEINFKDAMSQTLQEKILANVRGQSENPRISYNMN